MSWSFRAILVLIATLGIGGWLLYGAAKRWYFAPRASQVTLIQASTSNIERFRAAERNAVLVRNDIQAFINRTLGGDFETVDHRFRTRLNRLVETYLDNHSVDTVRRVERESPARSEFRAFRQLRDEIDFVEIECVVTGVGALEQALGLVEHIRAEPWIKRIDRLTLNPRENGSRFEINVRLTTLYLPQRWPDESVAVAAESPNLTHVAALAQRNPFRVPPAPAAAPTKNQPAPNVASPDGAWQLTGIARSAAGDEVWLLNTQTRESRRLGIGDKLLDLTLTGTNGESARFKLGEDHFLVAVGKNLGDRTPVHH